MRPIGLVLLAGLLSISAAGCGVQAPNNTFSNVGSVVHVAPDRGMAEAGDGGLAPKADVKPPAPIPPAVEAPAPTKPAMGEALSGVGKRTPKAPEMQSGLLTAGCFDDNDDPRFFRAFLGQVGQSPQVSDLPGRLAGHRLLVVVKDAAGNPVGNASVRLSSGNGGVTLVSRSDGRAVFVSGVDGFDPDANLTVTVTPADGGPVAAKLPRGADRWEVTLPQARAALPKYLDLALVVDTTGSMGDELEYLKSEIRGIVETVHDRFPEVRQRYSLILYRDTGDEYVTRSFDFTPRLEEFRGHLQKQRAGGGGDYPEAVHQALADAGQLRWRDEPTARVLFLVGDAPPHRQHLGATLAAVNDLRKKGVAIYPVACSGYSPEAELVFRGAALLTGAQFVFLTDDSGVGNAHGEPHIPFYHVQRLDRMMIRLISSELSGKRLAPEPAEIIRTVGKPIN